MAQQADELTADNDLGGWAQATKKCPHVDESCEIPSKEQIKALSILCMFNPIFYHYL